MSIIEENAALAAQLAKYSRLCYERRLVGAAGGNLSARVPGQDVFLVTASGVALRDVEPANLVAVGLDGKKVDGPEGLRPSKETSFHLSIYRVRPGANAVVHVHPPYSVVYASARMPIPLATVSAVLKLKQGLVACEADPGSEDLCLNVTQAVETAAQNVNVLLMERHGVVSWDKDLCAAFDDVELVEDTAKIAYLQAMLQGGPGRESNLAAMRVLDLTKPVSDKTPFYPTDPPYSMTRAAEFARDGVNVSRIQTGAHIGSHVDAPLHFVGGATDVASMPVESFFGPAVAIACPKASGQNIEVADLLGTDIRAGDIVLVHTGWEQRGNGPEFFQDGWPGFSVEAAKWLVARKIKAIGGDLPSVDNPAGVKAGAVVHKTFAAAGLPIFEALVNVKKLVGRRFMFFGLPLRLVGCEASPIRAVALFE